MLSKYGLYAVWVIAMIASATSLYLIEVQRWPVSHLSWYQLICMIPLAFISGVAAWHGFLGIASYLLPQSIVGLGLALYQTFLQRLCLYPIENKTIQIYNPGHTEPISIQFRCNLSILSAIAFLLISVLLFVIIKYSKNGRSK